MPCSPGGCYRGFMAPKRRPCCGVGRGCARCRRVAGEPREAGVVSHGADSVIGPGHLDGTASIRRGHPCPAMDARRIRTPRVGAEVRGDLLGHRSRCVHECCWFKGPFMGLWASPDISCPSTRIPRGGIAGETGHNPCAFCHFPPKPCPRGLLVEARVLAAGTRITGEQAGEEAAAMQGRKKRSPLFFFFPLWQPACPRKSTLWGVALCVRVCSSPRSRQFQAPVGASPACPRGAGQNAAELWPFRVLPRPGEPQGSPFLLRFARGFLYPTGTQGLVGSRFDHSVSAMVMPPMGLGSV